jgi:signal transduction histidine kinase
MPFQPFIRWLFLTVIIIPSFIGRIAAQHNKLDSLFDRAKQFRMTGELTKAMVKYSECLFFAQKSKDSLKTGNALIGIGIIHEQSGRYEEALQSYFKALDIYQKINNPKKIGGTLKNIGNIYRSLRQYDNALKFLSQAFDIQSSQKDSASTGNVLNDIGLVYMDQDSNARALSYFNRIIEDYGKGIIVEVRANVLNNLGLTLTKLKRYPGAQEYYFSSLELMQKIQYQYGIALVLGNLGDLYYHSNDLKKALDYHFQSLAIAQRLKSNNLLLNSFENLRKTFLALGNYPKAYEYAFGEMTLKDTIYKNQSVQDYEEMQAKYQYDKDQQDILLLQQNNKIANIEAGNQRRAKYYLLTGIILVLLLAGLLYRDYRVKQQTNKTLKVLNDRLGEADRSKTKLFSIISHDLRSPISSLFGFLQLQKKSSAKLKRKDQDEYHGKFVQSAQLLLDAMEDLLLWSKSQMDHFEQAVELTDVGELLNEIIQLNEPLASNKQICLEQKASPGLTFLTDPNFLRIILRNLISNAIKFSPARGKILLFADNRDGDIIFSVTDDGPGISQSELANIFEWSSIRSDSSGLGLRLAKEFAEKLGGRLEARPRLQAGTEFIVVLPYVHFQQTKTGTI